jgi:hypothetical protein
MKSSRSSAVRWSSELFDVLSSFAISPTVSCKNLAYCILAFNRFFSFSCKIQASSGNQKSWKIRLWAETMRTSNNVHNRSLFVIVQHVQLIGLSTRWRIVQDDVKRFNKT